MGVLSYVLSRHRKSTASGGRDAQVRALLHADEHFVSTVLYRRESIPYGGASRFLVDDRGSQCVVASSANKVSLFFVAGLIRTLSLSIHYVCDGRHGTRAFQGDHLVCLAASATLGRHRMVVCLQTTEFAHTIASQILRMAAADLWCLGRIPPLHTTPIN